MKLKIDNERDEVQVILWTIDFPVPGQGYVLDARGDENLNEQGVHSVIRLPRSVFAGIVDEYQKAEAQDE